MNIFLKILILFILVCIAILYYPVIFIEKKLSSISSISMSYELFNLTNNERKDKLKWNNCLSDKARERAIYIYENNSFSHTDLTGKRPFITAINDCINYIYAGENLTYNYYDATTAQSALMNSPTHKANILGDYTDIGISCYKEYCVEFFAK